MDATCNVQDSIHVFHLVHNMCPGFWVHIISIRILEGLFHLLSFIFYLFLHIFVDTIGIVSSDYISNGADP